MVVRNQRECSSSGLGSGSGVELIDERIRKLITSKVTRSNLDETSTMFGTIKKGIMELLDDRLRDFHVEIVAGQIRS